MWGAIFVQDSVHIPAPWIHIHLWTGADSIWVIELVPADSCTFSASPEGWSSDAADKVRCSLKLLSHHFKAWCNNKIPVWHPFHLIHEIVNWDCFFCCSAITAGEQQLSGEGRKTLFLLVLHFTFSMRVFELALTKVWFQGSSGWCELGLWAGPAPSRWLRARVFHGELTLGAGPAM